MIKKQNINYRKVSNVTFSISTISKAEYPVGIYPESVFLAGEFNDWDQTATPMKPNSWGGFQAISSRNQGVNTNFAMW